MDEEENIVERRGEEMGSEVGKEGAKEVEEAVAEAEAEAEEWLGRRGLVLKASWTVKRGRAFRWESSRSLSGLALQLACISNRMRVLDCSGSASKFSRGRGSLDGWGKETPLEEATSLSRCTVTPSMLYVLSSSLRPKAAAAPTLSSTSV